MQGYIKDYRKEIESDIWLMPPLYHRVWQWLKYMVNHEDNEIPMRDGSKFKIRKGQHLTSVRGIAKGVGWYEGTKWKEPNPKTINVILEWLVKQDMILIERGKGNRQYTLISLLNWDSYQAKEKQGNSKVTVDGEGGKHLVDINKNDKECFKNDKEFSMYVGDQPEENFYNVYLMAYGKHMTPFQAQEIQEYYLDKEIEEKVVCYAIEKGAKLGKDFNYVIGILNRCLDQGVTTYEQMTQKNKEFQDKRAASSDYKKQHIKKDKLPEWIENQTTLETEDSTDKRKKSEELLKALEGGG